MKPNKAVFTPRSSRRSMLKGTVVGVTSVAALAGLVGAGVAFEQSQNQGTAHAAMADIDFKNVDSIQTILNIAVTAETLATVFYAHVLMNANNLGFGPAGKMDIKAALVEEFLHKRFLEKQGGKALTTTFSFPWAANTFANFANFIAVQQQLESLFVAAYIAAGKEFAILGRPDLVQVAAQIGGVEAEHRAIGRAIGGLRPANNRVFESAHLNKVSDAVNVLKKDKFLNPVNGNMFSFQFVSAFVNAQVVDELLMRNTTNTDWSNY